MSERVIASIDVNHASGLSIWSTESAIGGHRGGTCTNTPTVVAGDGLDGFDRIRSVCHGVSVATGGSASAIGTCSGVCVVTERF